MALSFRGKLTTIVGAATLTFGLLIAGGTVLERQVERQLAVIQERYVPIIDLGPQLESQFDRLRRALQDAVASQDAEALAATRLLVSRFNDDLAAARGAVSPSDSIALRNALEDYYGTAVDVSRRLITGEKGEAVVEAMAGMQRKQTAVSDLLEKTTGFDRKKLTAAFTAASNAQAAAARVRLFVSLGSLALLILLLVWLSSSVLRSLADVVAGVQRFAKGQFGQPIVVRTRDELGAVAEQANHMAANLHRLGEERNRADWIKNGEAGLNHELRGDLEPKEVAARAVQFLARYLDAPAGALYYVDRDRQLVLFGQYAMPQASADNQPPQTFAPGEGLVGQAALAEKIVVIETPPPDYLRIRSALGEAPPRALVLVPVVRAGQVNGVLELALFKPWTDAAAQLMESVRETLAIAIEVARARASMRELLAESQRQAQRLVMQEEELRATNEELQAQQEELRQTNDAIEQRARELEAQRRTLAVKNDELLDARQRLEQKAAELTAVSTYKSQFLANMSHELRTPLNSMLLLSSLLAQNETGNLSDKQVEFCKTINAAGKDLLALINQVLDLAKIESGKQDVRVEPVPLKPMIEHVERMFGQMAREKGIAFDIAVDPKLPETIATDRQKLEQILKNLIGNAIKFTSRGTVALKVEKVGPQHKLTRADLDPANAVVFAVSDTGIGIPPDQHARVFEPFEQVESKSDRRFGGTGLGLPIARELATLLGGELRLHSEPGKGSTFSCYLPLVRAASVQTAPQAPAASSTPLLVEPTAVNDDRKQLAAGEDHLLVIEDDFVFANAFGEVIHEQGLKYVMAGDGQTGLRLAKERKPSGIILDVKLPQVDGWTVMEKLRADPETANIPVHFVSASDAGERGMAMGAVGYLTKPATKRDLVRVIESLTPKPAQRGRKLLVVEDDPDTADSVMKRLAGEHVETRRAASGAEALEALRKDTFDCMILDLSLPDTDGLTLLQSLQEPTAPEAPAVLVYTGRALSKAEAKRLEAYAEAVVLKEGPSAERLLDEVRLFIKRLNEGLPPRRTAHRVLPSELNLKGIKVLIVDDDMRTVYALSALLRSKGMDVRVADTGQGALAMLAEHPEIQIVLMDIMMPEMDGFEAMRRIRAQARFKSLPIIALTAKAMKTDREQCMNAGASDYLSKPIDPDRLLALMHAQVVGGAEKADG